MDGGFKTSPSEGTRERRWASGKWDLGEMLWGSAGGVSDYVPGRPASHGRGDGAVRRLAVGSGWQTRTRQRLSKSSDKLTGFSVGQKKKKTRTNKYLKYVFVAVKQQERAFVDVLRSKYHDRAHKGLNTY